MISCNAYDYIEIACLHRLSVRLHLHNKCVVEGIALDTSRTEQGHEAILIEVNESPIKIELTMIKVLESLTKNPSFEKIDISQIK